MAQDPGRVRAAEAAEQRRLELGLSQKGVGVDDKTWRRFVNHEKWPAEPLTRSRIEARLNWHIGALTRIANGESTPEREALESTSRPDIRTQTEAEAMLGRLMLEKEAVRRRVALLRQAAAERRQADVERMTAELDEILRGSE